jgi:cell division protein FtsB
MKLAMNARLEKTHRRADGRPWIRRRWWLLAIIAAALLAYLLLGSQASLFRLGELEEEKQQLHRRYNEALDTAKHYRDLMDRLGADDAFLEKLVRERLGLAAKGERVYVIIDKTTEGEGGK